MDHEESLSGSDKRNTGRKSQKYKSSSPEGSLTKKARSESGNSSSKEEVVSPCSNLSDSELYKQFDKIGISK